MNLYFGMSFYGIMIRPKVGILKRVELNSRGHYRYYPPTYNIEIHRGLPKSQRPRMPLINLNNHPEIKTEREFLLAIYKLYGEGHYKMYGYIKGRRGCWTFWQGILSQEGYMFYKKNHNKDKSNYKFEAYKEKMEFGETDKEFYKELEESERELNKMESQLQKYGFMPYLKRTGRRGQFTSWSSLVVLEQQHENWGNTKLKKDFEDWGNTKLKKDFEDWGNGK